MEGGSISNSNAKIIGELIELNRLEEFHIKISDENNNIYGKDAYDIILNSISKNTSIEIFQLHGYQSPSVKIPFDWIEMNKTIKKLNLNMAFYDEDYEAFNQKMSLNTSIIDLEMFVNDCNFLIKNETLKSLKIKRGSFNYPEKSKYLKMISTLEYSISQNSTLTHLDSSSIHQLRNLRQNHPSLISYKTSLIY